MISGIEQRFLFRSDSEFCVFCIHSECQLLAQSLSVLCGIATVGLPVFSVAIQALLWIHFRFCWVTFTRTQVKCVRLLKKLPESCRRCLCCFVFSSVESPSHSSSSSVLVFSELILWGMKWYYVEFYFLSLMTGVEECLLTSLLLIKRVHLGEQTHRDRKCRGSPHSLQSVGQSEKSWHTGHHSEETRFLLQAIRFLE